MAHGGTVRSEATPVETILARIVLAFRTAGWIWLSLLVVGVLLTDDTVDKRIAVGTAVITGLWTVFTYWVARDYDRLKSAWFVSADGVIAVGALAVSYASGSESNFYGGYPISWIAVVAFAATWRWAVGAGVLLFFSQLIGMTFLGSRTLTDKLGAVVFLIYGIIVGYAFDIIRDRDRLRAVAEQELAEERARQVRNDEQAHLADQLHDSVLQTLTAIRSAADDADQVSYLVRRQERELRRTIHQLRSEFENSFGTAMYGARDDVEDLYDIEIDMRCVFDAEMTPRLKAVVDATREALVNAAKHSGSKTADVYCGREDEALEAFIRDRGRGFDAQSKGGGFGLKNSIQRRITDVGGSTSITSSADMGTEVYISVPLS